MILHDNIVVTETFLLIFHGTSTSSSKQLLCWKLLVVWSHLFWFSLPFVTSIDSSHSLPRSSYFNEWLWLAERFVSDISTVGCRWWTPILDYCWYLFADILERRSCVFLWLKLCIQSSVDFMCLMLVWQWMCQVCVVLWSIYQKSWHVFWDQ